MPDSSNKPSNLESAPPVASDKPRRKPRIKLIEIEDELCKGCEICVELCPLKVFENSNKLNRKGYHVPKIVNPAACNGCRMCDMLCPEFAIILTEE
jgi:2-oxoglutarate ferredoxin oxidoreductase subunit delta